MKSSVDVFYIFYLNESQIFVSGQIYVIVYLYIAQTREFDLELSVAVKHHLMLQCNIFHRCSAAEKRTSPGQGGQICRCGIARNARSNAERTSGFFAQHAAPPIARSAHGSRRKTEVSVCSSASVPIFRKHFPK